MDEAQITLRCLIVTGGHAAEPFEPTDSPLDDVALAIFVFVEAGVLCLIGSSGHDIFYLVILHVLAYPVGTVTSVAGDRLGPALFSLWVDDPTVLQDALEGLRFVMLRTAYLSGQHATGFVGQQVDFGSKASLRISQSVIGWLVGIVLGAKAPAALW